MQVFWGVSAWGCERLGMNISATLTFLRFHAGSHLTIGVTSWTWNPSAVALDLKKRKLATKSCIASFLETNLCPKTGRYKISPVFKLTAPASTFRPCSTCGSCLGWFFPRRVPPTTTTTPPPPPPTTTTTATTTNYQIQLTTKYY